MSFNLDLIKQQIDILRAETDRQGTAIQKDMEQLTEGMGRVVQALNGRLSSLEESLVTITEALRKAGYLADADSVSVPPTDGREL